MKTSEEETAHHQKKFKNITSEEKTITGRYFDHRTFYKCSLKGSVFEDCNFENCVFEECDLSLIKLKETAFSNTQINGSKAIGIVWHAASNPLSVNFKNSRISYSSFYGKNLKKMQMIDCIADEADFTNCNLIQSNFAGTDLRNAIFINTDMSQANFVNATNYSINLQNNKTKKAKFSLPQALSFLHSLDIILVDQEL
ncbi:pentapeptide repeat-containing protein [Ferruginibacter paludis]|uniref:pentapeptide repeat-containing protein n=1 Tax=Ferruginibacter paludis TaxID=1310417 RepID=UPI0025B3F3BA|nr:pentapeptide repeat-containing protein [Ferruginibacter paludis]MDN3657547.1 pentapeptide repeat-containing protein [Ferruginibacter paludis]